jgi:4-amino-4-deoxy-L-arabinose transferase-like glycosyltransferase
MKKRVITHFQNNWKTWVLLTLIIALAAALRFTGIDWDQGAHLHPDERFLSMVTNDIKWPNSTTEYFDTAKSPLNPANAGKTFFVYGTFPIFLTKLLADLAGYGHYVGYPLVGRILSGLFDILTLIAVFLIAKKLFDARTALLSAFLFAISVIHIQHSHFYVVDLFATFFLTLTFYFMLLFARTNRFIYVVPIGISWGFSLASKVNSVLFAPLIGLTFIAVLIQNIESMLQKKLTPRKAVTVSIIKIILMGILLVAIAFVIFRILQPYAFDGPQPWNINLSKTFIESFNELSRLTSKSSGAGFIPSFQWVDRPWHFQIKNLTLWGLGIPLSIICWLGLLYSIFCIIFKKQYKLLPMTLWILLILTYQSLQFVKTLRYLLPLTPFLIILGAFFAVSLYDALKRKFKSRSIAVAILVLSSCLFWSTAFASIYVNQHPRIAASEWIYENVPENATIITEPWDDGIPFYLDGMPPRRVYNETRIELFGKDDDNKIRKISEQLSSAHYLFITSGRNYKILPRRPTMYPAITQYYELLFSGDLGYSLEMEFTNYPSLFGFQINDDNSEEAFIVYDHPKVLIFKNEKKLSSEQLFKLIEGE